MAGWRTGLVAVLFLTAAQSGFAHTCRTVTPSTTLSPKPLVVQRDLPVGSVIAQVVSEVVTSFKCTNQAPALTSQEAGFKGFGTYAGDFDNKRVWKTNIEGIGYAFGHIAVSDECGAGTERWVEGTDTTNKDHRVYCSVAGMFSTQPLKGKAVINFYKTAATTGTGTITGRLVGSFILRNNKLNMWMSPEATFYINDVAVSNVSCTLGSAAINVNMGAAPISAFQRAGTSQPSFRDKAFSIPLTCPKGASINVKIDGNVHDAKQGMLKLDTGASSATGAAIQVLYDDKPVELGERFKWQETDADGAYAIPFKARYVQTDSSVTPGVANASATFTVTYQ
ncbi:hypothetical protein R82526_01417 [Ralstonia mannitolilytica]|nr:hypothetical protein VZ52_08535 [Ralstonia mannitolilytica]CAJ0681798.1 hypothetical protein R82526_01417 [Ralstonia mannitolilytica]CAJ0869811.1 hypothetical protein R76727_02317 [Ralstonia mannitolilytica]